MQKGNVEIFVLQRK